MASRRKAQLTRKRQEWAKQRNANLFSGTPLQVNRGSSIKLQNNLDKMVNKMTTTAEREIKRLINSELGQSTYAQDDRSFASGVAILLNSLRSKFEGWFWDKSKPMSADMVKDVDKMSKSSLAASLAVASGGLSLKTSIMSARTREVMKASTKSSVRLIRTIPSTYFDKIEGAVMRSIQSGGNGSSDIFDEIVGFGKVTKKRAAFIATDQTSKATTALNSSRAQDLGVKKFKWLHSGGGKTPRPLHVKYDGQIFSFDDLPIIDERTGERGLPGQLIKCRCTWAPVIEYATAQDSKTFYCDGA